MNRQEFEPKPRFSEIQVALEQTSKWLQEWHGNVREKYNLTADLLENEVEGELVLADEGTLYLWNVRHELESFFGPVSVLQLEQVNSNPNHPLMGRFYYKTRNFEQLVAVSFGWRLQESDVVYEMVEFHDGKITKLGKTTRPGVLFPTPEVVDNEFLMRQFTQQLELEFSYDNGGIQEYTGRLGFAQDQNSKVIYTNGQVRFPLGLMFSLNLQTQTAHYTLGRRRFNLPRELDPIPHLNNFARHKSKQPLLS